MICLACKREHTWEWNDITPGGSYDVAPPVGVEVITDDRLEFSVSVLFCSCGQPLGMVYNGPEACRLFTSAGFP